MVQRYSCVVHALSNVLAACLLLCWRGVVSRFRSLVVLGVPSLSPPFLFFFFFVFFVLCSFFFVCYYYYYYYYYSTELSGSSVTGALGGPGAGGSWLGCGLGRPVGCSSALGM